MHRGLARPDAARTSSRCATAAGSPPCSCSWSSSSRRASTSRTGSGSDVDAQTADVLDRWESVLGRLETDPMSLAGELDWVAKLALLRGLPRPRRPRLGPRRGCTSSTCSTATCAPTRASRTGCRRAARWRASPPTPRSSAAVTTPPDDTRAWFRGECLRRYADAGRRRVVGLGHLRRARAATRCSGSPPSSRCAAPGRTSAPCSTPARPAADLLRALNRLGA